MREIGPAQNTSSSTVTAATAASGHLLLPTTVTCPKRRCQRNWNCPLFPCVCVCVCVEVLRQLAHKHTRANTDTDRLETCFFWSTCTTLLPLYVLLFLQRVRESYGSSSFRGRSLRARERTSLGETKNVREREREARAAASFADAAISLAQHECSVCFNCNYFVTFQ